MELILEPNEVWWSGAVADGDDMPYGGFAFDRDLGTSLGHTQGNPLMISSSGRYLWSEQPFRIRTEDFVVHAEGAPSSVLGGGGGGGLRDAFVEASSLFFPASGRSPDLRLFTAPQYNTWIELVYDQTQERVLEYARSILANGFPPGVLMIDDNWQEDYGVWQFHPARFPDPKAMITELHELGFTVMVWVCPFVSPDSATFRQLQSDRLLLRGPDGTTAIRRWWNGYSGVLDLTNPATVSWFHDRLHHLQDDFGVDGFKFDAGDPRFYTDGDQSYTPATPNEHCEYYARIGLEYPLNEYRACWKLANQPLGQRLKDTVPTWGRGGLASLIPHSIAQGLAGYAFNCPDMIGGGLAEDFDSPDYHVDEELMVRWAQASALFPMMQFSLAPWRALSSENAELCRQAANLRQQRTPLIQELVEHSAHTGEPILRNLEYVFPHQGLARVTDQYLLGESLMVAPVLSRGATGRYVSFPTGNWAGDDGSSVVGPCEIWIDAPLARLPIYELLESAES